jgi:hypothetical protein
MATDKDWSLVHFLRQSTESGTIAWEPTASDTQFVTGFRGKYNVLIERTRDKDGDAFYHMLVTDVVNNRELVSLSQYRPDFQGNLEDLYEKAQRQALSVDKALDDIMGIQ